jgi:type II secretory pathway pseudopilin PulG
MNSKVLAFKNSGFSLIEVMVLVVIMSLIGLGTSTLISNMYNQERRNNVKSVAEQIRFNLETILSNDTAWSHTVTNNTAKFACLRDNATAPCNNLVDINDFDVYNADGNLYYQGNSASGGFDFNGEPCNTFNGAIGSGDSLCPFRYNLSWNAECNGAGTCFEPNVRIFGELVYNPADAGIAGTSFNTGAYQLSMVRGGRKRYEPIEIKHIFVGSSPGAAGQCAPGAFTPRTLLANAAVVSGANESFYDPGNNVLSKTATNFELRPGVYDCKISATAYEATTGFNLILRDNTNTQDYPVGSGSSVFLTSAEAKGNVQLTLTGPATFTLEHQCGIGTTPSEFNKGIPVPRAGGYTGTVFTSISCIRSS